MSKLNFVKMSKISIEESSKNHKLKECGECCVGLFDEFVNCKDCGMILCSECENEGKCSSCRRDEE